MWTLPIVPISLNNFYHNVQGKGRVKTKKAKKWCEDLYLLLPMVDLPQGHFGLMMHFGTPYYATADLDNMVKPVVDVMQAKWEFNDKLIDNYVLRKSKTIMGCGFIEFRFLQIKGGIQL